MTNVAHQSADLQRLIGRTFVDRYRVDSLLGTGAMGSVFKGHQLTLKRDCAIKILHPELMSDESIAKRFEREAESAARLEHPNIMQVLEQGTTQDGLKFIVMQLLEGGELAARLDRPMPPAQSVVWAIQILSALEHAHAHGVIHRDLKPENVFVSTDHDGREILKLVDFGIAKIVGGPSESAEPMTKLGLVFGTPAYMSPEQATGAEIDERTDLYSAGVILYQMLAGAPPFYNEDPVALIRMQVSLDPPPLPDHVPPELQAVVNKLLAKPRDERFSSATEAREALEAMLPALDLDGLAIPSHVIRDVSGVLASTAPRLASISAEALEAARTRPSPPAAEKEAQPRRGKGGLVLGGLLVAAVAAGAWLAWPFELADRGTEESGAAPSETQSAGPWAGIEGVPSEELTEIDRLLLAKSPDPALLLIKPLRDQYPDDPRLLWREGKALALKKNKRDTALVRYGEALDANPSLIEDPDFYAEIYDLLDDRRLRAEALDFAVQRLGKNGHKFLLGLVNEKNPDRALKYGDRHRALDELATDPANRTLVDHELNLARDLWQAPQSVTPCAAYRDALVAISLAPDPLFLSTLRRQAVPKKAADDEDQLICDALPELRNQVLAAYELAYGDPEAAAALTAAAADEADSPAEGEAAPEEAESGGKSSGSKKKGSKKKSSKKKSSKSSGSKKKKRSPFQQFGKDLEEAFGGK